MLETMDFNKQKYNKLAICKELFYVLGALLGDGCIYKWRNEHQIWLIGDENFAKKYTIKLSKVLGRKVNKALAQRYRNLV